MKLFDSTGVRGDTRPHAAGWGSSWVQWGWGGGHQIAKLTYSTNPSISLGIQASPANEGWHSQKSKQKANSNQNKLHLIMGRFELKAWITSSDVETVGQQEVNTLL